MKSKKDATIQSGRVLCVPLLFISYDERRGSRYLSLFLSRRVRSVVYRAGGEDRHQSSKSIVRQPGGGVMMDPRQINPDGSIGIKRKAPNFRETLNSGNRKPYLPLFSFPPFLLSFFLSVLDAET